MKEVITDKTGFKSTPLGPIPLDWDCSTIGELVKFSGGSQPPLKTFLYKEKEGYVRLIQTRDYRTDKYKTYIPISEARKICEENDIMIGRYGPPLFQIFRGLQGAYNVALIKAIPNEQKVDREYCYYFLTRPELRSYIEGLSQRSGGQTGVEIDKLNDYPFPLPSLKEQQSLASTLSTWDKAIEKTTQLIAAKERRKKWLMQQLLTGKKRLKGFKDDWSISNFDDCFEIVKSYSISRDGLSRDLNDSSTYCIHYGDIHALYETNFLDFSKQIGIPQITGIEQIINNRDHLFDGDLILADASEDYEGVGEAIEVTNLGKKSAVGGLHTIVMRAKQNRVSVGFRAYLFASEPVRNELRRKATGTSVYSVTKSTLQALYFKLPSPEEQKAISNVLRTADKEIDLLKQKLEAYKGQKKGLMQVLLTGKVRLKVN